MTRRKRIAIPAGLIAASAAVWAWTARGAEADAAYRLAAVEAGTVESVVTATGVLQPTETVEVGTQVSGQVSALYVDFNDLVEEGQLLARIDPTILEQEVRSAEAGVLRNQAEVDQATRTLERNRGLFEERVLTLTELEQSEYAHTIARASLASAEVALERARRNLSYTEIRAPIDGIVVERSADLGQTVAASMSAPTLFLLAQDLSQMEILASVDESDIGRIATGQEVRFTVQAYGDQTYAGVVKQVRLQSVTQDNVVSYGVVISVDNAEGQLLPAMTATVEFIVARADDVLKVPNAALRFQPTAELLESARGAARPDAARSPRGGAPGSVLWVVSPDGAPSRVPVETGLTDGQYTVVRGEGVAEGAQVVTGTLTGTESATAANPFQSTQQRGPGGPPTF